MPGEEGQETASSFNPQKSQKALIEALITV